MNKMIMLTYKGYKAYAIKEQNEDSYFGRVIGIRDVITFKGVSIDEVTLEFYKAIDDYLIYCAELGEEPNKPNET